MNTKLIKLFIFIFLAGRICFADVQEVTDTALNSTYIEKSFKQVLGSFDSSLLKNNKIDIACTSLALAMMASYAFIGSVPPHVASSSTLVHAIGSLATQRAKNKIYSKRLDDLKELKKQIERALSTSSGKIDTDQLLKTINVIENNIISEIKTHKKTYILRLLSSVAFMIGYFIISEAKAMSKQYPEILSESEKLIKISAKQNVVQFLADTVKRRDANPLLALTADPRTTEALQLLPLPPDQQEQYIDAELDKNPQIKAAAIKVAYAGVGASFAIRTRYGFSKEGKYFMYLWLIGAILEIANLDYIRCSNRDYSKVALDEINKIKTILAETSSGDGIH